MNRYPPEYFTGHGYGADPKRAKSYEQEYKRIRERCEPGLIFDYGCGVGGFLAVFDDRWKKYGWDISEYAREHAEKNGVQMVEPCDQIEVYDAVVFRGTIQHIDTPMRSLRFAYQALKPGGLLAITATPNTESLVYQLFHTLPALDPPRNWFIPGAHEMWNILHNLGFKDVETLYPYLGGPYAHPLRDAAHFALRLAGVRLPFAWPRNMMELYCRKP